VILHNRVLALFADDEPHTVGQLYAAIPGVAHLGSVCRDLVADGCLEDTLFAWRITAKGWERLEQVAV
jgi:hypothetical protein